MSRDTCWVSVQCSKSHSHYCSVPEHTRTDMCTSLSVNPSLPLHSLGQPGSVLEGLQAFTQHSWIQRAAAEEAGVWADDVQWTVWRRHDSMGQDRSRNPVANSLQTALEPCPVSSALLYHLLLENLIQLHPVVQSSEAAALSAFKFLLADLNVGAALP